MLFLKDLRDGAIGGIQFNFDGFDLNRIIFFAHRLDRLLKFLEQMSIFALFDFLYGQIKEF